MNIQNPIRAIFRTMCLPGVIRICLFGMLQILLHSYSYAQENYSSCEDLLKKATKENKQLSFKNSKLMTITKQEKTESNPQFAASMMACAITASGLMDVHCNDNGTPNNQADDYVVFFLKPTGGMLSGTGYNVSMEGVGTTISPASAGTYATRTRFRLGNGSANANTWSVRITDKADPNCFIVVSVNCPSCSQVCPDVTNQICIENNTTYTLTAPAGLTNVTWYDSTTRTQIGTGSSINIDKNTLGLADGYESYFFKALNEDNCEVYLCCPARFRTAECFDIALKKEVVGSGPFYPGLDIIYNITVYNQGVIDAYNINIADYIPTGMTLNDPAWTGNPAKMLNPIANIPPGGFTVVTIKLKINSNFTGSKLRNWAEVFTADDDTNPNNTFPIDKDSNPDDINFNQPGETNDLNDDNIVNQNGKAGGDEDDHDPAEIDVVLFDLALRKTVDVNGPYIYGQTVPFRIRVYNQGGVPAANIQIVDYIPTGLTYALVNNPLWSYDGVSKATRTLPGVLQPGDSVDVVIQLTLNSNPGNTNAYLNYAEIKYATDPNGLVIPDFDSSPDDINGNDSGGVPNGPTDNQVNGVPPTDEDDHDPAIIHVYDLALRKSLVTPGPYSYGQVVDFRITVFNQGTLPVRNIQISDYIPEGYIYLASDNVGIWSGAHPTVTHVNASTLSPGGSFNVFLKLRLDQTNGGFRDWINYSEITRMEDQLGNNVSSLDVDSNPGSNGAGENAVKPGDDADDNITSINEGGEEDDHDPAGINIFDLALRKTVITAGPYSYGQNVDFRIRVFNQGNTTAQNINLVDYVPLGFQFIAGGVNSIWNYTSGNRQASAIVSGPLRPGDSLDVTIRLQVLSNPGASDAYLNYAEIKSAQDSTNAVRSDIDSSPDDNPSNDTGGQPGGPTDNEINDDGALDEDDQDPAFIHIWDLALRKVFTSGTVRYNNNLTFTIWVYNQGTETAQNIVIKDYIPEGYSYSAGLNPGWTGAFPNVNYNIAGPLNPGDSVAVTLVLTLENTAGGFRKWINYSEISSSEDLNNNDRSNDDADSMVESDGPAERAVLPGRINDNNITSINKGAEEDDHDPAGSGPLFGEIFDLALKKNVVTPAPYSYGQNIDFRIRIYNQGNVTAQNISIADYVPVGFDFIAGGVNATWSYSSGTRIATRTFAGPIQPGDSAEILIRLQVLSNPGDANAYINFAEIRSARDTLNVLRDDIDSSPDDDANNDIGGQPGGPTDDMVDDDGTIDEDDHDPAFIHVYDLALRKVIQTAGPYAYDQILDFNITVFNQGTLPVQNITISDYIPAGYNYIASDNTGVWTGAYPSVTHTHAGLLNPGGSFDVILKLRLRNTQGAYRDWINYAEITRMENQAGTNVSNQDVDSNPASDGTAERAVKPGDLADNNITSINKGGEEDDHDPAGINIFDIALRKSLITAGPYTYGQNVDFRIRIFNQGNTTAQNINVVDYVPAGFQFIAGGVNSIWNYTAGNRQAITIVNGPLKPGDSAEVMIRLQVLANPGQADAYINFSEIRSAQDTTGATRNDIDSSPDDNSTNDSGGQPGGPTDDVVNQKPPIDEDDHDPAFIHVYDLALRKTLITAGPYTNGQAIDFRITIFNQGTLPVRNVQISDYIPAGYSYLASDNIGIWSGAHPLVTHTNNSTLSPGGSFDVILRLRLTNTSGGYRDWINYAEITRMEDISGTNVSGQDVDSNPGSDGAAERAVKPADPADDNITSTNKGGEEDDHDPAGIQIFDLALRKTITTAGPYTYGQDIDFNIQVFNQGNLLARNINIVDYVPEGYQFIAGGVNAAWTYNFVTRQAVRNIVGPLAPGNSTSVTIRLRLIANAGDSEAYTNIAEIRSAQDSLGLPGLDMDSTPDDDPSNDPGGDADSPTDDEINDDGTTDEDDQDPARISVYDLALRKVLTTPAPYNYGQDLVFKIWVLNQGNEAVRNISIQDYIPSGYQFIGASNPGWASNAGGASITLPGTLLPGDSVSVDITLRLDNTNGGYLHWINYAEITRMENPSGTNVSNLDIDSNPASDGAGERNVKPGQAADNNVISVNKGGEEDDHDPAGIYFMDLALRKSVITSGPYTYGQTVDFRIKVYNQGNMTAQDVVVTDYLPVGFEFSLSNPLSWSYNAITRKASTTLSGPIRPGDSAEVHIRLVVLANQGDHNAYRNEAEITQMRDTTGVIRPDFDSTPDNDEDNDDGGVPNGPSDDEIDEMSPVDEDDHDPAIIHVYDLALRKVVITPAPYSYGQTIDFNITVFNQGTLPVTNVLVEDHIPIGYSYNAGDNAGIWSGIYPGISHVHTAELNPGDSFTVLLRLQLDNTSGGLRDWINYSEIASFADSTEVDISNEDTDSNPDSDNTDERNVKPGDAPDNNITSIDKGGEEDDHDPAGIYFMDLALRKTVITGGPYDYNQTVDFRIMVYNQGNIPAQDVVVTDYVPTGFAFAGTNPASWTYNAVTRKAVTTIGGPIKPGDSAQLIIQLVVLPNPGNFNGYRNVAEITQMRDNTGTIKPDIDSSPDDTPNNDPGGVPDSSTDDEIDQRAPVDEDDHDPAIIHLFDLALRKVVVTPQPYSYDQLIDFRVTVINQGTLPVTNIVLNDFVPIGYSYQIADNPGTWTGVYPLLNYLRAARLNPGDSFSVSLKLRLENTAGGFRDWINYAEIRSFADSLGVDASSEDVDSNPDSDDNGERAVRPGDTADNNVSSIDKGGEEDDHDPAGVAVFDLSLRKIYTGTLPIRYDQVVPFEITVYNQGNISAQNPQILDYIPVGYIFVPGSNPTWSYNAGTRIASRTYLGKILPGDSIKLFIYLRVVPTLNNRNAWKNFAEIYAVTDTLGNPRIDIDSNPDNDPSNDGPEEDDDIDDESPIDEDDQDPAIPQILDLALRKWIPGKKPYYIPGDTVNFIISLHNQGNVVSQNIGVNDYMPQGFQFLAGINPGWTVNAGRLEYTHNSRLNPEDSVQISLRLRVIVAVNPTINDWENYAEIRSVIDTFGMNRTNDDADSQPNTDDAWERAVHDDGPWDDVIDGNGQIVNEDSDDHDPEKVVVTAWIGDYVWKDLNANGIQDLGEPPIQGVHVYLYTCDGALVSKDTTNASGKYEFDFLVSNSYFLRFDIAPINMPNCAFTFMDRGNNNAVDSDPTAAGITPCTFLEWGERDSTWDAGLVELTKYGDFVWHDRNANGIQDLGEEGIKDVNVTLFDSDTGLPVKTTTTNANGLYLFEFLMPGNYYAKYDWHPMWNQTGSNIGSDIRDSDVDGSNGPRTNATTYLSPGEDDRTWDLGLYKCIMIGGRVFLDVDKDGFFDASENGINGVNVHLVDAMTNVVVATLKTAVNPATPSDDGYYKFACVKPGMYYVRFERPGHLAASEPYKGGNQEKDSDISHENGINSTRKITVLSGDMVLNMGAGFQDKATVGDRVWLDLNVNGIQDVTEKPVQGVVVSAYDMSGTMVSLDTSKFDGTYMLDGIAQGDFFIKFTPPAQYGFTVPKMGSDLLDSDVTGAKGYGTTRVYRLLGGDALPYIDAGLVSGVLPIEWLSFDGQYNGTFTKLDWTTGVEINNSHFVVERRHESETGFQEIGQVGSAPDALSSKHDYDFNDHDVVKFGVYYYRIKQIDLNGSFTYSRTISIRVQNAKGFGVEIYPNPVDDILQVETWINDDTHLEVIVYDENGKNVLTQPFGGWRTSGKYTDLLRTDLLLPGHYHLQIKTSNGIVNKKFSVAR